MTAKKKIEHKTKQDNIFRRGESTLWNSNSTLILDDTDYPVAGEESPQIPDNRQNLNGSGTLYRCCGSRQELNANQVAY